MRADDLTGAEYPLVKGHGLIYQERLAPPSMDHDKVAAVIAAARTLQRRLMKRAEVK